MAMEIHFCSLCNESVPQSDLDLGRAFVRRGRVICAVCERAMTHEVGSPSHGSSAGHRGGTSGDTQAAATVAPTLLETAKASGARPDTVTSFGGWAEPAQAPAALIPASGDAPAATRSSTGLVLAMVALIFTAGAVAVLNEQIRDLGARETAVEGVLRRLNQSLDEMERGQRSTSASLASMAGSIDQRFASEREGRESSLASMRAEADQLSGTQKDLTQRIDEMRTTAQTPTSTAHLAGHPCRLMPPDLMSGIIQRPGSDDRR